MSCVIIPPPNTEAILDTLVVQTINEKLAELTWLQACYGIVQVAEMKKDDLSIERFPRVYANTSDRQYYDVRYDDQLKAQTFFERESETPFGLENEKDEVTYSLSLVCWANLTLVDPGRSYDFTDLLAGAVLKVLEDNFEPYISNQRVELRPESVYSKYTLSDADNKYLTLPYTAFKISFDWTEFKSAACYGFTPIGGQPC